MARALNPAYRPETHALSGGAMSFQRGKGLKRVRGKRKKKITMRFKHILVSLFFVGGVFFFIQQAYLFLISWDYLKIKEVNVICSQEEVKEGITAMLRDQPMSNILLLNINRLRKSLAFHPLVKEVHIRKLFPSTLKIDLVERKPIAILNKEELSLVDEEGVLLGKIQSREGIPLPLLIDSNNFQKNYKEKITFAWECLKSLPASEKAQINTLDLSEYGWVSITLNDGPTQIKLGQNAAQNLEFFHEHQRGLEERFGPLEYIDLRFEDRIYLKTHPSIIPNMVKEVQ